MTPPAGNGKGRGCTFYVGVTAVIFLFLVLSGVLVGYLTLRKAITTWTDTSAVALPKQELSRDEALHAQQKIDQFKHALSTGESAPDLTLTAREINGFINASPELAEIKDKLYVEIVDGRPRGKFSIPLDRTKIKALKGRYLNGSGAIRTRFVDGRMYVTLDDVSVKGKPLPRTLMQRLRSVNFAQKFNDDPRAQTILGKLEKIELHDSSLTLCPKR